MVLACLVAELEHVPEDGDTAARGAGGQVVERRPHRQRVRVVAVVHEHDVARQVDPLAAQVRELDLEPAAGRHADRARRGGRGERVAQVVRLHQRRLDLDGRPVGVDRDLLAVDGDEPDVGGGSAVDPGIERDRAQVLAQVGGEQRLAGRQDRRALPRAIPAISSAFAAAIASSDPSSSRWTGATFVITPTSGSQISTSSAISPGPRMPSSSTSASVPGSASRIASGSPMSVLKFCALAWVRRWGESSAARMSFVDVLPVEPVTAST